MLERIRRAPWAVNAAIVFASSTLSLIALYGGTFLVTSQEPLRYWWSRLRPLDNNGIGIWQRDARLGYSNKPMATGRHTSSDFDVRYSIDATGCRATPDPPDARGDVLMLGDSFTFGHGVGDADAYPAVLGARNWNTLKVRNCAGMGWGTGQASLIADDALAKSAKPKAIFYGWIWPDLSRNYRRRSWLEVLNSYNRRNVDFDISENRLVYRGTAGPELAVPDDAPELPGKERAVTQALIRHMAKAAAAASTPFYVVLLPFGNPANPNPIDQDLIDFLRREHIAFIDLRALHVDGPAFFPTDGHPTPILHRAIAAAIAAQVPLQ